MAFLNSTHGLNPMVRHSVLTVRLAYSGSEAETLMHAWCVGSIDLDRTELERKVRLLTLASLGFQNLGKDLPYSTIASALQIEPSQVEKWVIDGVSSEHPRLVG
jgi:hypothetical protein